MGYLLKSGEVGNIGLKHQKAIREATVNKWNDLGFLEGLEGHIRENIALLYENQASVLINESTSTAGGASTGHFETVVFPIVRRVFSKLLANDIVSVQALNLPIGKLFFFVPKTSERNTDGSHNGMYIATCVGGCPEALYNSCAKDLYDRFYNDGMFDQSKGKITIVAATGTAVTWTACTSGYEFAAGKTPAATDGSLRNQIVEVTGFNNSAPGRLIGPDGNEMDTESFLASLTVVAAVQVLDPAGKVIFNVGDTVPFRLVTQKYGRGIVDYGDICSPDGKLNIDLDLTHPTCVECGMNTFDGYIGANYTATTINNSSVVITWRQYEDLEMESNMGEVSFELDSITVSVTERKLRATWTPELAQDVSAFHNIDAEAELTALLSEQIAAEIDREILMDLRKGAAWQLRWDYNGWKRLPNNNGYTQKDWNQTLMTAINQISAQIHKATLRGGANFVVVSSEVSAVMDDLEYFHVSNAAPEQDSYNMGIERVGSLSGRYTVYRDPYSPSYSIIIGHKGKSLLDTGYIYAPYVPMQLTPTMYNPFNFVPVKGIMTRYAKKMVNNRFYGHIRVDGLRTFDIRELR
jgi:Major capsid protein Gp23